MTSRYPIDNPQPGTESIAQPESQQIALPKPVAGWRLWVPLLFQAALIVAIPAQDAYTFATGKTVVLQTAPVDPYDLVRGYSQTLGYTISNRNTLEKLPGGEQLKQQEQGDFYVVLEAPANQNSSPPQPWKPVRVSGDRPTNLSANQVALKGQQNGWQIAYGLESYYMPEDQRQQINQTIAQAQQREPQAFVVEAKVDASGNAVPASLWIRDRNYRF